MWMKITIKQQKYRREHHNSVDIKAQWRSINHINMEDDTKNLGGRKNAR